MTPRAKAADEEITRFKDYVHPAFQAERLVLVTNQLGSSKVSVYAMGHLKPGKTVQDIAASKGVVPEGTGAPGPLETAASQPATEPAGD